MVSELKVSILGSPGVMLDGEPVSGFGSVKAQALVYYLAATGLPHQRDALAWLLAQKPWVVPNLTVNTGCGRVQRWGGSIEEIRPGDVVQFAPGENHWHGAAPTTAMTHIAIQEALDGKAVEWLEHVSDKQYRE